MLPVSVLPTDNDGWGFLVDAVMANMFQGNTCNGNGLGGSNQPAGRVALERVVVTVPEEESLKLVAAGRVASERVAVAECDLEPVEAVVAGRVALERVVVTVGEEESLKLVATVSR